MAEEGTIEFFSGNDVLLRFTVMDEDNPPAAKDLSGALEIIFVIAKAQGKTAALTKSLASGISITDAAAGEFEVTLTKSDTEPLGPTHQYYEVRVKDVLAKTATVAYGTCTISKNSITT